MTLEYGRGRFRGVLNYLSMDHLSTLIAGNDHGVHRFAEPTSSA